MPSIKLSNQTTSANSLTGLKFSKLTRPSLITLYAAGVTVTDTIGLSLSDREVLNGANPNLESSADVVDVSRDLILAAEPGDAGEELFMPVVVSTATNFLLVIDEL